MQFVYNLTKKISIHNFLKNTLYFYNLFINYFYIALLQIFFKKKNH